MKSRRNRSLKRKRQMTRKRYGGKPGKKWVTAIEAAKKTLHKIMAINFINLFIKTTSFWLFSRRQPSSQFLQLYCKKQTKHEQFLAL